MRANAVHLNDDQMEAVAKFIIMDRGVEFNEKGEFVKFRVSQADLAKDVMLKLGITVTTHSIKKSVHWFLGGQKRFGGTINVPPAPKTESVQDDILKERIAKLVMEVRTANDTAARQLKIVGYLQERLNKIKNLSTV